METLHVNKPGSLKIYHVHKVQFVNKSFSLNKLHIPFCVYLLHFKGFVAFVKTVFYYFTAKL